MLTEAGDRVRVFSASAHMPLVVFRLSGAGWMAGPACLVPEQCVALYNLARAGRWEETEALQRRLWPVNQVFQKYALAACVKAGLRLQGIDAGDPLPPQPPLGPAAVEEIRRAVARATGA